MREYVLSYYPLFKCTAGECKHTCCANWDVYIDEATLNSYKNNTSCYAKTLLDGIYLKKSMFKKDKHGRCAFLNNNGLCDIILNLGEQSLCQICTDHPRFKSFLEDRIETGLGFCCEKATEIILSFDGKIEPVLIRDDEASPTPSFIQDCILSFRQSALNVIQNRSSSINERITDLLALCNADASLADFKSVLKLFCSLEKLDKEWGKKLKKIKKAHYIPQNHDNLAIYCEQFLSNSFYRHLSDAEDTLSVRVRAAACIFSWWIICAIYENEADACFNPSLLFDTVREFSSEVEYSQKNCKKLYAFANKFIKI